MDEKSKDKNVYLNEQLKSNPEFANLLLTKPIFDAFITSLINERSKLVNCSESNDSTNSVTNSQSNNNNGLSEFKICNISQLKEIPPTNNFAVKAADLGKLFNIIDTRLKDKSTPDNFKIAMSLVLKEVIENFLLSSNEYSQEHYFIDYVINLFEDSLKLRQNVPITVSLEIVKPISDFLLPIYDKARKITNNQLKLGCPIENAKFSKYYTLIKSMVNEHQSLDMVCAAQKSTEKISSKDEVMMRSVKTIFADACPHLFQNIGNLSTNPKKTKASKGGNLTSTQNKTPAKWSSTKRKPQKKTRETFDSNPKKEVSTFLLVKMQLLYFLSN